MLAAYRRHRAGCKHRSRRYKSCSCPIWAQGILRGKSVRKSLGLTSWEAAARKINELEIHGDNAVSVETAVDRWLDDCAARNLKPQSVRKYREVGKELKVKWAGYLVVSPTVDDVRKLREGWKYQGTTTQKRLELVRAFFSFCLASGWIQTNPGKMVKAPKVRLVPTLPYSDNEWKKILWALDAYGEIHEQSPVRVRKQLRALVLLLRYSGLRISDAVSLKRERVDSSGRLFVYTQDRKSVV